jgi:DNA invertase Pin-like site-specific DNA recombinase
VTSRPRGLVWEFNTSSLQIIASGKDIEVVAHYKEDHSAKDFNRPEFQNFLRFAKKNKNTIDYLLVTTWDRFSRNVTDSFVMIRRLRTMGIEVQAIEQPIDFKVPESKAMLALNLVLA